MRDSALPLVDIAAGAGFRVPVAPRADDDVAPRWSLAIVTALLLAGCASVPSTPRVMALPGSVKSADDFRSDDASRRQAAAIDAKVATKWRDDMTHLQCMYAKGNQIPVPSGMFAPTPVLPGSSPPAPTPAPATAPRTQPAT